MKEQEGLAWEFNQFRNIRSYRVCFCWNNDALDCKKGYAAVYYGAKLHKMKGSIVHLLCINYQ